MHENSISGNFQKIINRPTVFLFPGHSPSNYGTSNGTLRENTLAQELCELMTEELEDQDIPYIYKVIQGKTKYKYLKNRCDIINDFYDKNKNIIAVSIHFDSSNNPYARGGHVIFYPGSGKGKELASYIATELCEWFPGRSKKITERKLYFFKYTKCTTVLVETCFLKSMNDMEIYNIYKKDVAKSIVAGIKNYIDK